MASGRKADTEEMIARAQPLGKSWIEVELILAASREKPGGSRFFDTHKSILGKRNHLKGKISLWKYNFQILEESWTTWLVRSLPTQKVSTSTRLVSLCLLCETFSRWLYVGESYRNMYSRREYLSICNGKKAGTIEYQLLPLRDRITSDLYFLHCTFLYLW